jgi:hypothetical protein
MTPWPTFNMLACLLNAQKEFMIYFIRSDNVRSTFSSVFFGRNAKAQ